MRHVDNVINFRDTRSKSRDRRKIRTQLKSDGKDKEKYVMDRGHEKKRDDGPAEISDVVDQKIQTEHAEIDKDVAENKSGNKWNRLLEGKRDVKIMEAKLIDPIDQKISAREISYDKEKPVSFFLFCFGRQHGYFASCIKNSNMQA